MPSSVVAGTPRDEGVALDARGLPLDRTVCPSCLNSTAIVPGTDPPLSRRDLCETCDHSGTVCPLCRGAHWTIDPRALGGNRLIPCDGCLRPALVSGEHAYDADRKRHRYERDDELELATIDAYRREHVVAYASVA